ncbi:single-stranded DNA-binding protein [Nocardia sputi]|uniref:single-stranded DNA-binding protein n=1 Tax=Nocardia sputi TaxID=2943705 RepID=UPI0020C16D4E|nr:single-stranded DNA-binding protein [Nocardia sputi]
MPDDTIITIKGNLTADPELRFTPSGVAVCNLTVASTPRVFDRNTNEWKDGTALFLRCTVWREAAENVAETLRRGMRVIVEGKLKQRNWQTPDGHNRSTVELEVDEIGPSLKFATAKVQRAARRNTGEPTGTSGGENDTARELVGAAAGSADPWGAEPGF